MSDAIDELLEGYSPEFVDRRAYLYDDAGFGYPNATNPFTTANDRLDGRCKPYYDNEIDLAYLRGAARNLSLLTPTAQAALDRLAEYTFGPGFKFTVKSQDKELEKRCQAIVTRFLDDTNFIGVLDRELHHRSREDGEAFAQIELGQNNRPCVSFYEPDQIREPANINQLEDWLQDFGGVASWSFGIRTPRNRPAQVLGYHVSRDDSGQDWDYVPVRQMVHIKRNSGANAKRGISDMFLIVEEIARESKLRRNMAEGAALQSAIAWILESPPGTSQASIQTLGAGDAAAQYGRQVIGGQKNQRVQKYNPGTVLKPSPGLQYKPGPMGSERNDGFLAVSQYLLRIVGTRWAMPEYMISGDASNANYASALVAESPFVKAREADQAFYARSFMEMLYKVLRFEWERGKLPQVPWSEIEGLIEISVDKPNVSTRNPKEIAEVQAAQLAAGILSKRTAAVQAGLDYDAELRNIKDEQKSAPGQPPGAAPGQGSGQPPEQPQEEVKENPAEKTTSRLQETDCGTGKGGFKPGNTCAAEDGNDAAPSSERTKPDKNNPDDSTSTKAKKRSWFKQLADKLTGREETTALEASQYIDQLRDKASAKGIASDWEDAQDKQPKSALPLSDSVVTAYEAQDTYGFFTGAPTYSQSLDKIDTLGANYGAMSKDDYDKEIANRVRDLKSRWDDLDKTKLDKNWAQLPEPKKEEARKTWARAEIDKAINQTDAIRDERRRVAIDRMNKALVQGAINSRIDCCVQVYRGMEVDEKTLQDMLDTGHVGHKAVNSWTTDPSVASAFTLYQSALGAQKKRVILVADNPKVGIINKRNALESEIIRPPSNMRIKKVTNAKDATILHVDEDEQYE